MDFNSILEQKRLNGNLRSLKNIDQVRLNAESRGKRFINVSSNDYMGLARNKALKKEFLDSVDLMDINFSASSSRLLTGTCSQYESFEKELANAYGAQAALTFASGYHANEGILPAVSDENTLILADKLVHASLIDGIKLSNAKCIRYRHNDYAQLERLIQENSDKFESIIIVTESIFSMDGDEADLDRLVQIKKDNSKVKLYIDEAHAVGLRGENGLGCCEQYGCIHDVDFLVGTLGKGMASMGAYVICSAQIYSFLVNTMCPFIFTTALPPINIAWSRFILSKLHSLGERRSKLQMLSSKLHEYAKSLNQSVVSTSHIIPIIIGDSERAVKIAERIQQEGFYVMAVRPPTVPAGSARLRISLHADLSLLDVERLIKTIDESIKEVTI